MEGVKGQRRWARTTNDHGSPPGSGSLRTVGDLLTLQIVGFGSTGLPARREGNEGKRRRHQKMNEREQEWRP